MAQRFVTAQRLRTRALRLAGSLIRPKVYRITASRVVSLSQTLVLALEPRTWWGHEGAMSEPWRGFLVSFAGPGGQEAQRIESRSACSARCARGEQPTHRRLDAVEPSTRSSLARSGRLRAALFANPMGSPRFAALLLLLLPRAGTPLSLKNTYWTASIASRGSHSHHPAQAPGAPGPRPPLIRTGARPHPRDRRHRRPQESVLPARRV